MAKRIPYIPNRVIDTNGISDGATIDVFQAGTTTRVSIYSEESLTTPLANPYTVVAGAAVPAIYHGETANIRVRVKQSDGTTISDDDPFEAPVTDVALASPDAGKGAALVGLDTGGNVQQAINISRTALKALAPINGQRAYLNDGKASGLFVFDGSDLQALVAIDVPEGVYIASDGDATGASGAWVRQTSNEEYYLEWFKPAIDGISNDLAIINAAITLTPLGGSLIFPGGDSVCQISGGSVDFRNKADTRFYSVGGRFRIRQATANTPVAYYGANEGSIPQSGGLDGFNFVHATQQTNAQTSGNGLVLYWCSNAIFNDLYAQNCYSPYTQATDKGTASFNVVFDCSFDNIYAYGFTGRGFHLEPIGTAGTPNNIKRMYLNAGGQTAVRGLSLVGQDENIEKLNIENGKFSDALVWNSGAGSSVRIGKLYTEKASVTSTHRGLIYVGTNGLRIDQWQINSTTFDSADATTVYLATFFDGVIDIGSFGITGTTLTGPPTLQMFRAFNSSTNPAREVSVSSVLNPASVAISLGDTRDTLITKLSYPWPEQQTIASGNADFRLGWTAVATLTANILIDNPVLNSRRRGRRVTVILTQDGTGGRTVTWGSDFVIATAINTAASSTTVWNIQWDGVKWREV